MRFASRLAVLLLSLAVLAAAGCGDDDDAAVPDGGDADTDSDTDTDTGPPPDPAFPGGVCRPGVRRLFVAPDGTFLPCERVEPALAIGCVDGGFAYAAIDRLHAELLAAVGADCGACWAQRLCGVCLAALGPDPGAGRRACAMARQRAEAVLRRRLAMRRAPARSLAFLEETTVV